MSLPPLTIEGHEPTSQGNEDHPMRLMTRRAAGLVEPPWDDDSAREVGAFFDSLAPEWHTRSSPERAAVVRDAIERGDVGGGTVVEVGSGISAYTPMLLARFERVLACDLAFEMLRLAPDGMPVAQADASRLPLGDGSADAVVLVNMFLFPDEVDRVLAPDGCVVWVNSSGPSTPIHLRPDEVVAALPGEWTGVTATAGAGLWAVVRRVSRGG